MVLPLGPPMEGLTPPSSSAMRPRSCATCRSCSSSCSRCCSTFSWAIRCELSPVNAQRRRDAGCHARSSSGRSGTDRPRRCPESGCPWAGCAVAVVERRGHFAGMPWQKQVWGSSKRISNADTANLAVGIEAPSQAQVTSGALQLESHSYLRRHWIYRFEPFHAVRLCGADYSPPSLGSPISASEIHPT